jgi:hypothetical protein
VGVYVYVILQAHQFLCFYLPIHIEYVKSRGWAIGEIVHIRDRWDSLSLHINTHTQASTHAHTEPFPKTHL